MPSRARRLRVPVTSFVLVALLAVATMTQAAARPVFPAKRDAGTDPVIAAAGDIACDPADANFNGGLGSKRTCHEAYTAALINAQVASGAYQNVLTMGDEQYECGGYSAFLQSYAPTWGQFLAQTLPAIGNHEYMTSGGTGCAPNAAGYSAYFGAAAGTPGQFYYSTDIGAWHVIALNGNCAIVSCQVGSAQETWLAADLAAHPNTCTLAFLHQPRFASGNAKLTDNKQIRPLWNDLVAARADLLLAGHKHLYERLGKMDANGVADPNGMREIIAGTGGKSHGGKFTFLWPTSEARTNTTFGYLELTLHPTSYDWRFIQEDGTVFDQGSDTCSV